MSVCVFLAILTLTVQSIAQNHKPSSTSLYLINLSCLYIDTFIPFRYIILHYCSYNPFAYIAQKFNALSSFRNPKVALHDLYKYLLYILNHRVFVSSSEQAYLDACWGKGGDEQSKYAYRCTSISFFRQMVTQRNTQDLLKDFGTQQKLNIIY